MLHDVVAMGRREGVRDWITEDEVVVFAATLLDAGARLDVRDDLLESTPLGWACRWGRAKVVTLMLERGADPVETEAEPWATPRAWGRENGTSWGAGGTVEDRHRRLTTASSSGDSMNLDLLERFSDIVDDGASRMLAMPDRVASEPRAAGKWSRKEIVGHLIDSAVNNQIRFVRAQMQDDLIFPGYDQDAWVRVQRYRERSWPELVEVWRTYNRQIAAIIRATPRAERDRPRPRHNVHEIGFQPLPAGVEATLGFLMQDYVAHLRHHLSQVLD